MLALLVASVMLSAPPPPGEPPAPAPAAAAGPAETFDEFMREGDLAYAGRDEPDRLALAIDRYRAAAAARPGDVSALLALCRAGAFRALAAPAGALEAWQEVAEDAEQALRTSAPAFAAAIDRGEDPVEAAGRVEASAAEPLYFLALATMGLGQARGMAAMLSVREVARGLMERAAILDERIDHGGPCRALGAWLATLPSAAGGGAESARREFLRASALFPGFQLNELLEAKTLAVLLQDRPRFEGLIREVLAFDETSAPETAPENRLAKRLAKDLLAREDRLF